MKLLCSHSLMFVPQFGIDFKLYTAIFQFSFIMCVKELFLCGLRNKWKLRSTPLHMHYAATDYKGVIASYKNQVLRPRK